MEEISNINLYKSHQNGSPDYVNKQLISKRKHGTRFDHVKCTHQLAASYSFAAE